jgi:hypothetical protein
MFVIKGMCGPLLFLLYSVKQIQHQSLENPVLLCQPVDQKKLRTSAVWFILDNFESRCL